jgi:hypothetical protein
LIVATLSRRERHCSQSTIRRNPALQSEQQIDSIRSEMYSQRIWRAEYKATTSEALSARQEIQGENGTKAAQPQKKESSYVSM